MSDRRIRAVTEIVSEIAAVLDLDLSVRLWDGTRLPLGANVTGPLTITLNDADALTRLLRWPTFDRLLHAYANGVIDLDGGSFMDLIAVTGGGGTRKQLKSIDRWGLIRKVLAIASARIGATGADSLSESRTYAGNVSGHARERGENRRYIQFHYDVGNDFYELFLDDEMVYTCAYFTDWDNDIHTAQRDKLDIVCRKLRLKPGDKMLDLGCGWGALSFHAVQNYGVTSYGVTLSEQQVAYANDKIRRLGLEDRMAIELKPYQEVDGAYDKIAAIGLYEHIGISAYADYFAQVRDLLTPDGLFLNHGITRGYRRDKRKFGRRPEQRAILKYIFPGGELDDIGDTVRFMEGSGLEVHDVEALRDHYALTTHHWCERLTANREKAAALAGDDVYRIWVLYLAGVSAAFTRNSLKLYQVLTSRRGRGRAPKPPTRDDIYVKS